MTIDSNLKEGTKITMSSSLIGTFSHYKFQVKDEVMGSRLIGCVCNFPNKNAK